MPGIFLAAPTYAAPPVPAASFSGLSGMTWTGWDGSEWDLLASDGGVFVTEGVRGLGMPQVSRYTSESPGSPGSRWRGSRTAEREVFWPTLVFSDGGSQEWIEFDRAFWRTMHPERPGVWTVTQPSGESRSLSLRYTDDGGQSFDRDPSAAGWCLYGVTLVAEQPYWQGDPVIRSWKIAPQAGVNFFGPTGFGPPFYITSGSSLATAVMDNPGDVDAWPVWTIIGPSTSVSVGVGDRLVTVPFPLAAGEKLTIDTRPSAQTAVDGAGVERTGALGAVDFAPVPAGESVPLSLSMAGSGEVQAALTPLYYRAW